MFCEGEEKKTHWRDRQTETDRQTDRQADRQTDRDRDTETERDRQRQTETERQTQREREKYQRKLTDTGPDYIRGDKLEGLKKKGVGGRKKVRLLVGSRESL